MRGIGYAEERQRSAWVATPETGLTPFGTIHYRRLARVGSRDKTKVEREKRTRQGSKQGGQRGKIPTASHAEEAGKKGQTLVGG